MLLRYGVRVVMGRLGVDVVLAASIFLYGEYRVQEAKHRMWERGIKIFGL